MGRGRPARRRYAAATLFGLAVVAFGAAFVASVATAGQGAAGRPLAASVPVINVGTVPVVSIGAGAADRASHNQAIRRAVPGTELAIASQHLHAAVVAVTAAAGVLSVPGDPRTVGWWSGSAPPGAARGTTVIDGHINFAGVRGALAVLLELQPGAALSISEPGSRPYRYAVQAIRSYPKTLGIPVDVFSQNGPARLVLITCGGRFDQATGIYEDNIVAYAVPID